MNNLDQGLGYIGTLIREAREIALFKTYGENYGFSDEKFILWANKGLDQFQAAIDGVRPRAFSTSKKITVDGGEYYNLPSNIIIENLVHEIAWKEQDTVGDWLILDPMMRPGQSEGGEPETVLVEGNKFYPNPIPTNGYFRVRYEAKLDRVDIRRGKIETANANFEWVDLVADTFDDTALSNAETDLSVVCVSDKYGNVTVRNLPIDSWDSSSRRLAFSSDFSADTGETIAAGSYITIGADTTTHPKLMPILRSCLLEYLKLCAQLTTSKTSSAATDREVAKLLGVVMDLYAQLPELSSELPEKGIDY
jgi:hypothetical protein